MKILAFDTSSKACSVALQHGDQTKILHEMAVSQPARHILPMINTLLNDCALKLNQLDAIAYGCGPGSFTGIRIASSIAQGLGHVIQVPIISISSMAAIAQTAFLEHQWDKLLVAVNARENQLYWSTYAVKNDCVELIGQESVCTPEETNLLYHEAGKSAWYGIGDAWEKYSAKLIKHQPEAINSTIIPSAQAILKLAAIKLAKKDWIFAKQAVPSYIHEAFLLKGSC